TPAGRVPAATAGRIVLLCGGGPAGGGRTTCRGACCQQKIPPVHVYPHSGLASHKSTGCGYRTADGVGRVVQFVRLWVVVGALDGGSVGRLAIALGEEVGARVGADPDCTQSVAILLRTELVGEPRVRHLDEQQNCDKGEHDPGDRREQRLDGEK